MFVRTIGQGTPVVLLHGFQTDHRSLLPLEPTFARVPDVKRIYLDLPGHGRTPAGDIDSAQAVAEAVLAEVRGLVGDEPFALVGESFGGMIARYVAHELRSQVLGLTTVVGVFVAAHADRTVPSRTVLRSDPAVEEVLHEAALELYRECAVLESAEDARAFERDVLPGLLGGDSAALDRIFARYALDREPEDVHPEPFTQPTLHLTGRQDQVVGYHDAWSWIEHYPRASFVVLDAAGHNARTEQPELFTALFLDWLGKVLGSR